MKCFHRVAIIFITSLWVSNFTVPVANAEELKTAHDILEFSTAKMDSYKTWTADYTQNLNILGTAMTIGGRIAEKLPHEMWMQLDMPMMGQKGQMTIILGADGIMWQIMQLGPRPQIMKTDMNEVLSNAASATGAKINPFDQMNPTKQWGSSREMYDFKVVSAKETDGQQVYVLEGLVKPSAITNQQMAAEAAKMGKMRVSIGREDGFVRRMELYDKSLTNLVTAMEFKNLKFNPDLPASTFVYQPPADAHVTDMTAMFEMQMRAREEAGNSGNTRVSDATHRPRPLSPAK